MPRKRRSSPFSLFAFQDIITSTTGVILLLTLILTMELLQRDTSSMPFADAAIVAEVEQALADAQERVQSLQERLNQGQVFVTEAASVSPTQIAQKRHHLNQEIERLQVDLTRQEDRIRSFQAQLDTWESRKYDRADDFKRITKIQQTAQATKAKLEQLHKSNRVIYNQSTVSGKTAWIIDIGTDSLLVARLGHKGPPKSFQSGNTALLLRNYWEWIKQCDARTEYFVLLVRPQGIELYEKLKEGLRQRGFDIGYDLIGKDITVIDPNLGAGFE